MPPLLQPGQVGIREDLADYIAVVDAKSTPFSSMVPKGKELGNMRFDWQVDDYDVAKLGGVPDGTDLVLANLTNASQNRDRLENYAQVFQRDFRVGFVAETQNVAGVSDEVARSVSKRMLEMKRDIEATLLNVNQPAQLESGTTPYLTSSLGNWLTGTSAPNTVTVGVPSTNFTTPATSKYTGTALALVEANVQAVLTSIYDKTGSIRSYDLICGTALKRSFTNLIGSSYAEAAATNNIVATAVRTFNMDIDADKYKHTVDVFQGDFGTLMLHPDVFIGGWNALGTVLSGVSTPALPLVGNGAQFFPLNTKGYVIPMEMCELRYTQLPKVQDLPDNGGGPAKLIRAIAGLVIKNPLGFGFFNAT